MNLYYHKVKAYIRFLLLFNSFYICNHVLNAQEYMVNYRMSEKSVINSFKGQAKKNKLTYDVSKMGDTLIIYYGCQEGIINKFLFDKVTGYCIYHESDFKCEDCAVEFYTRLMKDWEYNLRKVKPYNYLFSPKHRTILEVFPDKGKPKKFILTYGDMSDEEYEKKYDSLVDRRVFD